MLVLVAGLAAWCSRVLFLLFCVLVCFWGLAMIVVFVLVVCRGRISGVLVWVCVS